MQTAMQELIERLETLSKKHQNAGLLTAIEIGNSLLEMEKQQIIYAWEDGSYGGGQFTTTHETSSEYYTSTYGSKGSDDEFDVEKEMFELEQQLDIPSHMRWHNRTSSQTEISDE